MTPNRHLLSIFLAVFLLAAACGDGEAPLAQLRTAWSDPVERDLGDIEEDGVLRVLVTTDSTSYFIYRGTPMGYDYALLKRFTKANDLKLEMVLVRDREQILDMLDRGQGDVAVARLLPDYGEDARAAYTVPLYETPPVLVQREEPLLDAQVSETVEEALEEGAPGSPDVPPEVPRLEGPRELQVSARLIRRRADLDGVPVAVPGDSDYSDRAVELFDLETADMEIVEVEDATSFEVLIREVARGDTYLAASPRNLAQLKESYFTNITVYPTLGPFHPVAWAVRKSSPELLAALDEHLESFGDMPRDEELYERYFVDRRGYRERRDSEYLTSETGRLSPYDGLLRTGADVLGWDWRLLASQAYQESRFNARARSWAGAAGLLQLMPATAKQFKVENRFDPEENVEGGVAFLTWLENYWDDKIEDPEQRLYIVLASYNTGHGHVQDARRLAKKYGDDPDSWEDIAYWLIQKSKRKYYTDPVVKYGYVRGLEPVTYVERILERYGHYRLFVESDLEQDVLVVAKPGEEG